MKLVKLGALLLALVALFALVPASFVSAQGPVNNSLDTQFTTSITYQNVGSATSDIQLLFFSQETGTPITVPQEDLEAGAGASVFVGALNDVGDSFQGSAVLNSSEPVVATLVQVPQGSTLVNSRPLSNGFSPDQGATRYQIPTVLRNTFSSTTVFSIQNVSSGNVNLTVKFYNTNNNGALFHTATFNNLPANSAKYYDMSTYNDGPFNGLGQFNGSVVIEATGNIVASAMELSPNTVRASAFEGFGSGATSIFMPSALCKYFNLETAYAVQNVGTAATTVTVTYTPGGGTQTATIAPGAKQSFNTCTGVGNVNGYIGGATITSSGGQQIVAIGKAYNTAAGPLGFQTAFIGSAGGSSRIALPYVRWTEAGWTNGTRERAFLAIQNTGTTATNITVTYRDRDGVPVATQQFNNVAPGAKVNSNAHSATPPQNEFGYYNDGGFGGGAIIEGGAGSSLTAIVRVQRYNPATGFQGGEDYSGIGVQ